MMTAMVKGPKSHKVGPPIMLTLEQIDERRKQIEAKYGTRRELEFKLNLIGLSLEERNALRELKDLDYLSDW
ncbi:hypothetical protein H7U32_04740 [Bifidobacterium pullorum subsp. saeculare]|uniref:Uncharacterized protein n=1 Tax=Bifidobacterium pullorum subsp. saeculare TaxID=78257 RepID=A0A938WXB6_9BIFI|nr:hypothetical protein [Bifidobacterium pullorum]MBM6699631.1 hypothetical protein [Bifidobacterium pullorum subsp. saeculare]